MSAATASLRDAARAAHPEFPWLDAADAAGVERLLRARAWLVADERVVGCAPAGEGNMNLTLRVVTDRRSLIVKQARPWVERYDHIAAPWERSAVERRFYERVAALPEVARRMPRLLAADDLAHVLLLEDVAGAEDCAGVYAGNALAEPEIEALATWAAALHAGSRAAGRDPVLANRAMRALNHAHIFVVPFAPATDLELDRFEPGLAAAASALAGDAELSRAVAATGERYLADGPCLVHGDFFPGSWLRTPDGPRVIDPEFAFYGEAELDVGCAVAHFALARQADAAWTFLDAYEAASAATSGADAASDDDLAAADPGLVARYAAVEVMRRLIGVAQLPISPSRGFRAALLARARSAMLDGDAARLLD